MSGGIERIAPEVVAAVEEAARYRIMAPRDKELLTLFPELSRASIYRIMKAARKKLHVERMRQMSQSRK